MTPGSYLKRRRCIAGYSISSLGRELLHSDHFGRRMLFADQLRIELRLIDAEAGTIILPPAQVETIASFARLDPEIYRDLVDVAERRSPAPRFRICRSCACSDTLPCRVPHSGIPGIGCHWTLENLCSCCAAIEGNAPRGSLPAGSQPQSAAGGEPPFIRVITSGEPLPAAPKGT